MTTLLNKPRKTAQVAPVAPTADRPDPALAAVMSDLAFVLRMTKSVKDAIMDAKPLTVASKA